MSALLLLFFAAAPAADSPAPAEAPSVDVPAPAEPPPADVPAPAEAPVPNATAAPPRPDSATPPPEVGAGATAAPSGERLIHFSMVRLKRQVAPKIPKGLDRSTLPNACDVQFHLDARGVPTRVDLLHCDADLQQSAVEAAMKFRFSPYDASGKAESVQFRFRLHYPAP